MAELRVGRVVGADVVIDSSLLLMGPIIVVLLAGQFDAVPGIQPYAIAALYVVGLYASIFLHEFAHLLMGRAGGRSARRIELMLFGGVTMFDEGATRPGQQFLTSIVGPVTSLAIGAGALAFTSSGAHGWVGFVVHWLGWTNIVLGLFNLLPGLPLDGGHAVRAVIWKLTGRQAAVIVATAWIGRVVAVLVVAVTVWRTDFSGTGWIVNVGLAVLVAATMWQAATGALRSVKPA